MRVGQAASVPIVPAAMQNAGKFKRIVTGDWLSVNSAGALPASLRKAYEAHLTEWADREGQFVLIKGRDLLGHNPRHNEALKTDFEQLGARPFLIKQILLHGPIHQLIPHHRWSAGASFSAGKISGLSSVLVKTEPRPIAFHDPT